MTEVWRLLRTWDLEPGLNMALDEALLLGTEERPTLRFYTWKPAALSLGYFQRWSDVPEAEKVEVVVRRLTGGGAIHHENELTYSIAAPADHALFRGPVRASYERIHRLLASALETYGARAALRGPSGLEADLAATGLCFRKSSDLDLVWDGAKGVGSAQRRTGGRVLHHGSIKLGGTEIEQGIATLWTHAPELTATELAEGIGERLAAGFEVELDPSEPSLEEVEHAAGRAGHFTGPTFTRRR